MGTSGKKETKRLYRCSNENSTHAIVEYHQICFTFALLCSLGRWGWLQCSSRDWMKFERCRVALWSFYYSDAAAFNDHSNNFNDQTPQRFALSQQKQAMALMVKLWCWIVMMSQPLTSDRDGMASTHPFRLFIPMLTLHAKSLIVLFLSAVMMTRLHHH